MSYPEGASVNDAIPQEHCTVQYTSFDEAVNMVCRCRVRAELAKCNIKSAFQILPVLPQDFDLLGFYFQRFFYIDRALPIGCSVSFLEWKLRSRVGCKNTAHYLDQGSQMQFTWGQLEAEAG